MKTSFWKMHGAGNDFILIDDRQQTFPDQDHPLINRLAASFTAMLIGTPLT